MLKYSAFVLCLSVCAGAALAGDLTQFVDRPSFDFAHPAAVLEDFEEANVPDGVADVMPSPADSFTSNDIFAQGDILPNVRVRVGENPDGFQNLFVSGPGFANYLSHVISFDSINTTSPQITVDVCCDAVAVGLDVTSNPDGNAVAVRVFSGDTLLGSFPIVGAGAGTFFGIESSGAPITRIELDGEGYFGVDNIAVASADQPCPGDLDADGDTDFDDLGILLGNFGNVCD